MPLSDHARWRVALRIVGIVVAVAGAGVAVWLIVRGDDSKTVQIGVIIGLVAALLGSAILPATRGTSNPSEGLRQADLDRVVQASSLAARTAVREASERSAREAADSAARQAIAAVQEANSGELERRRTSEVERERDEATRREFALSLELMLRREMERVLRDELDALRQEVAGLRNDLTEKVPGQIRLERIETTRLIGSDLEALQAEVRRLGEERIALGATPAPPMTRASTPASVRPAEPDWSTPTVSAAVPDETTPPVVSAPEPFVAAPEPVVAPEPEPMAVAPVAAPTTPEPTPTPEPVLHDVDPFAGLPRLSRWVDPYADSPDVTPAPAADGGHAVPDAAADEQREAAPRYVGRRRQPGDDEVVQAVPDPDPTPEPAQSAGRRHARDEPTDESGRPGGRRRRPDEGGSHRGHTRPELVPDDVLARLLGR